MRDTGSALPRIEACPASAALAPRIEEASGQAAAHGTSVHAVLEAASNGAEDPLAGCPAEHRDAAEVALEFVSERLPDLRTGVAEVAFALRYDKIAARELGRGIGRSYGVLDPAEVALTIDWGACTGPAVVVLDYKTGWRSVGRAYENLQLMAGALAAAITWNKDRAIVGIVHLPDGGSPWLDSAEVSTVELLAAHKRLRSVAQRVAEVEAVVAAGGEPDVRMGEHCRYCPGKLVCPGRRALVRSFSAVPEVAPIDKLRALAPAELPEFHARLRLAEGVIAGYREALKTIAKEHAFDLGDGKLYGEHQGKRQLNLKKVKDVIGKLAPGGLEAAVDITEKTSQAALKRAAAQHLGPAAKSRAVGKLAKEILAEVERVGGVFRPLTVGEFKADDVDTTSMPADDAPAHDDDDIPFK